MKVAVSSTGNTIEAPVNPRFGRCEYFVIVDTDNMNYESFSNENVNLSSGAGIQSASFAASKGVEAVLTGNCGPKAAQTFSAANIPVYTGYSGTVRQAVEQFKTAGAGAGQQQQPFANPSQSAADFSQPQSGLGPGRGMGGGSGRCRSGGGRGMGGGGGMGLGGGSGRGMRRMSGSPAPVSGPPAASSQEELTALKEQAAQLKQQLEEIEKRINALE